MTDFTATEFTATPTDVTYKPSGIDWLGNIPSHWEVRRLKNIADVVLGKMLTPEDKGNYLLKPYLKSKNIGWGSLVLDEVETMWFSKRELELYRIKENDLLVSEGGEVGKTAMWFNQLDECYIQNSVHKITMKQGHVPKFYLYYLIHLGSIGFFKSIVNQVSIAHLTKDILVNIPVPVPPIYEQKLIADSLDHQDEKINQFLSQKQRFIDLLREQKQVIINEAVTKGLYSQQNRDSLATQGNPYFADSAPWLADVPKHWSIVQLKRVLSQIDYGLSESSVDEGAYKFLNMGHIQDGRVYTSNAGYLEEVPDKLLLRYDDLLYNRTNSAELVAKVGIFKSSEENVAFASYLVRLRSNELVLPDYLCYCLNNISFISFARSQALVSINQANLNPTKYTQLKIPVPPLAEQAEIVDYIEREAGRIDTLVRKTEREMSLMQEYRQSMIAEAVTGKMTVHVPA